MPAVTTWPLLDGVGEPERAELLAATRRREFARNEVVCHAGDPADSLHLVESGRLAVRVSLDWGATVTLRLVGPGDYFGELALLRGDHRRTATVIALEPTRTRSLAASAFHRLCERQPRVERALTELLAARVDELSQELLEALYVGLDRRVYRRLSTLNDDYGGSIPLTQTQLAELVGGTRPSVNQVLQRLEGEGVVALGRGRIDVLDASALARKAG